MRIIEMTTLYSRVRFVTSSVLLVGSVDRLFIAWQCFLVCGHTVVRPTHHQPNNMEVLQPSEGHNALYCRCRPPVSSGNLYLVE